MSTETKPFAKSLHTVSVLCKVARLLQQLGPYTPDGRPTNERAVQLAKAQLGHNDKPDAYSLCAAAVKQLDAEDEAARIRAEAGFGGAE
jgi:hypothetical protein